MSHLHTSLYIWTKLNSVDTYFVRIHPVQENVTLCECNKIAQNAQHHFTPSLTVELQVEAVKVEAVCAAISSGLLQNSYVPPSLFLPIQIISTVL